MKTNIKKALFINRKKYVEIKFDLSFDIDWLDVCAEFLKKEFDIIQITNINCTDRFLIEFLMKLRQLCSIYNSLLIVKSRCDMVQLSNADGVIIDKNDIDISDCKKILNENCLIGSIAYDNSSDFDFILCEKPAKKFINAFVKIKESECYNIYEKENL